MKKFHINKNGELSICRAKSEESCRAIPPDGIEQFHGTENEASKNLEKIYETRYGSVSHSSKKTSVNSRPSDELIGSKETDVERLENSHFKSYSRTETGRHVWLKNTEGTPIGFINFVEDSKNNRLSLSDIEIRPEYRNRGLSRRLIEACEKNFGKKMFHDGGYTPEGRERIAHIFKNKEDSGSIYESDSFESMSFVHDWDSMRSEFPL